MKTIFLFAILLTALTFNTSAQLIEQAATATRLTNEEISTGKSDRIIFLKDNSPMAAGDTIYTQDFSSGIPAGWSQTGTNQVWKVINPLNPLKGCFNTGSVLLNSTTAANGSAIFDADSLQKIAYPTCSPVPCVAYDGALVSAPIDLTAAPYVKLRFQQRFRLCCQGATKFLTVSVSSDGGTTWTDYDVQHGISLNQYPASNPDPIEINITAAAGGKNVLLKWSFKSDCGAYFWQIDDIALVETPTNDLVLVKAINDMNYVDGGYYTMIPYEQAKVTPMTFRGIVLNDGTDPQTSIMLNADVKRNGSSIYNNSGTVLPLLVSSVKDTMAVTVPFNPPATGDYSVTWNVTQNETDGVPINNSVVKNFVVTDTIYSRDDENSMLSNPLLPELKQGFTLIKGSVLTPSNYVGGNINSAGLGNLYEMSRYSVATSVTFYLDSTTGNGAGIIAGIYKVPSTGTIPNVAQTESAIYNVVDATYKGKWVTLQLTTGDNILRKDSNYIVGVRNINEGTTSKRMRLGTDLFTQQPNFTSWLFYQNTSAVMAWGWINVNPRIRLNLKDLDDVNFVRGTCFMDNNGNNIKDIGEPSRKNVKISSVNSQYFTSAISNPLGKYENLTDTGKTTTSVQGLKYYICTPTFHDTTFSTYKNVDTVNFAFVPVPNIQDLRITLIPLTSARRVRPNFYRIVYQNIGTKTMSGSVFFSMDTLLGYYGASPVSDSVKGNVYEWIYSNLLPDESRSIDLTLGVKTGVASGTVINLSAYIEPISTDSVPADNTSSIIQKVVNSFDPNDKMMSQGDFITKQQAMDGIYMDYVIRFQNTGNDTALRVVVRDTLDGNVDGSSFEMVSASHDYTASIRDDRSIVWTFENILLPDSTIDEPNSHGYICYRIKPMNNLQFGDIIRNKAYIYFDYNSPVITDPAITTITDQTRIIEPTVYAVNVFPNPNNGSMQFAFPTPLPTEAVLTIFNVLGTKVKGYSLVKGTINFRFNESMADGTYFYRLISNSVNYSGKFIICKQ